MHRRGHPGFLWVLAVGAFITASCSSPVGTTTTDGVVTVFAAASLTDAFTEIAHMVESADGPAVRFSFAGSSTLATQILDGAPADVFASADHSQMVRVVDEIPGLSSPIVFARNELVIVVEAGNPLSIQSLADLSRQDILVALADRSAAAGAYTEELFQLAGVTVVPATYESDVRAVLTKIELGEVDAGLVYATDATSSDRVQVIRIESPSGSPIEYPIAALDDGDEEAAEFLEAVLSERGQSVLANHGFIVP